MITREEIKKLASLARIDLTEQETETFAKDIGAILKYVDAVKEAANSKDAQSNFAVRNVLREDTPVESDASAEDILKNAPSTKDGYIEVKKILEGKK